MQPRRAALRRQHGEAPAVRGGGASLAAVRLPRREAVLEARVRERAAEGRRRLGRWIAGRRRGIVARAFAGCGGRLGSRFGGGFRRDLGRGLRRGGRGAVRGRAGGDDGGADAEGRADGCVIGRDRDADIRGIRDGVRRLLGRDRLPLGARTRIHHGVRQADAIGIDNSEPRLHHTVDSSVALDTDAEAVRSALGGRRVPVLRHENDRPRLVRHEALAVERLVLGPGDGRRLGGRGPRRGRPEGEGGEQDEERGGREARPREAAARNHRRLLPVAPRGQPRPPLRWTRGAPP